MSRRLLIRGGMLHTMTDDGGMRADLRMEDGVITEIGPELAAGKSAVVDASGCHVTPGLVDVHLRRGMHWKEPYADLLLSGVAHGLIWPEGDGLCRYLPDKERNALRFRQLQVEEHSARWLHDQLNRCREGNAQPAIDIRSRDMCRMVLDLLREHGQKAVLSGLNGCGDLAQEIAEAGCDVIIGPGQWTGEAMWPLAVQLDALGVRVCVSTFGHEGCSCMLRSCAAMCWRSGMHQDRALHTITRNGAELLGHENAGRIDVGCRRTLVIFSGDPLLISTERVLTITEEGCIL